MCVINNSSSDYSLFGDELKNLREVANLTQGELARLVSCSTRTIQKWESRETFPKRENVKKLLEVFFSSDSLTKSGRLEQQIVSFCKKAGWPTLFAEWKKQNNHCRDYARIGEISGGRKLSSNLASFENLD